MKNKEDYSSKEITNRELEILSLVAKGYSDKKVSDVLNISSGTVRNHLCTIYKKFNVNNRVQAIIKAQQKKLI